MFQTPHSGGGGRHWPGGRAEKGPGCVDQTGGVFPKQSGGNIGVV